MKKVLFVCLHRPDRSPSQRFRFEQYLGYLKKNGFDYKFSWLLDESDDKVFYSPGKFFKKGLIVLKSIWKRISETARASDYDIVFVQREALMLGTAFFEKRFAQKTKLIFDFDDSIWLQNVQFLRMPGKQKRSFNWLILCLPVIITWQIMQKSLTEMLSSFQQQLIPTSINL
jgi:hypothetical protein